MPFSSPETVEKANATVTVRFLACLDRTTMFQYCSDWVDLDSIPEGENQAVVSDIPTLILSGEFDPVTPPAWGQLAAETLSRSQFLEFTGFGHGILGSGKDGCTCSRQIVSDFITDPESAVDASCVSEFELVFR